MRLSFHTVYDNIFTERKTSLIWFKFVTPCTTWKKINHQYHCLSIIGFLVCTCQCQTKKELIQSSYLIGAGFVVYLAWGSGTVIGAYFTQFMSSDNTYGLEFASTACFILLVISDLSSWRRVFTLILCAVFVLLYFCTIHSFQLVSYYYYLA